MVKLTCLEDLHAHPACQNIKSLQEVIASASKFGKGHYYEWKEIEKRVQEQYQAPSLTAWLLYEHHFNNKSLIDIAKDLGMKYTTLRHMVKVMRIPTQTQGEQIHTKSLEEQKIALKLIKEEIQDYQAGKIGKLSTIEELVQATGIYEPGIQNCIRKLTPEEKHLRRVSARLKVVDKRLIREVAELVKKEIEDYRSGELEALTDNSVIGELAGINMREVRLKLQDYLPKEDLNYRAKVISGNNKKGDRKRASRSDISAIIDLVREEIGLHREGKLEELTGNPELARRIKVHTTTLQNHLHKHLSKEDCKYRGHQLNRQTGRENTRKYGSALGRFTEKERWKYCSEAGKANYRKHGNPAKDISTERRRQIGRAVQEKYGRGFAIKMFTPEERREIARKRIEKHGNPLKRLTPEQIEKGKKKLKEYNKIWGKVIGRRVAEMHRKNAYYVEERFYASSQQEGAVALLLEDYLPNFIIKEGENFQVKQGVDNGGIDFKVDSIFLEWHPIMLYPDTTKRGDLTLEGYLAYKDGLATLPQEERAKFKTDIITQLADSYAQKRKSAISPESHPNADLVVATNESQLYNFISQYSTTMPDFTTFKREFRKKVGYVKGFKVKPKTEAAA